MGVIIQGREVCSRYHRLVKSGTDDNPRLEMSGWTGTDGALQRCRRLPWAASLEPGRKPPTRQDDDIHPPQPENDGDTKLACGWTASSRTLFPTPSVSAIADLRSLSETLPAEQGGSNTAPCRTVQASKQAASMPMVASDDCCYPPRSCMPTATYFLWRRTDLLD
jgi:hypothetical protein